MSEIFISYSRQDSPRATQLTELLESAGLRVWMDTAGIAAATSWSREIVSAIDGCRVFIVLLSGSSVQSHNVVKEVSLASEKRKKILPIELEPVILPEELQYQLAGIQRGSMSNIDAIIRALVSLGLQPSNPPAEPLITRQSSDSRKTLMVLPFEDLSPTGDNGWFADGIASELISTLSNIKALRVTDWSDTKEFKRYQGKLVDFAREMNVRYFIGGDVRKFGDNIKISARLLDIQNGDFLWQDTIKGTMSDVFEVQEEIAKKVVDGLQVALSTQEVHAIESRGTENAEAYEYYLRARDYDAAQTKESILAGVGLIEEAVECDPAFLEAYLQLANFHLELYRLYDRKRSHLEAAERQIDKVQSLEPDNLRALGAQAVLKLRQGSFEEAIRIAERYVRLDPENADSHFILGVVCAQSGQCEQSLPHFERVIAIDPNHRSARWNLFTATGACGRTESLAEISRSTIPIHQRRLRLHPDDERARVELAILFAHTDEQGRAREMLGAISDNSDPRILYDAACLAVGLDEPDEAIRRLQACFEAGFCDLQLISTDPDLDSLRQRPDFIELYARVEEREAA